ncbi:hypothetical protein PISMIDRAFT_687968 [Pisolithus microcarpus 441]|uniref:Uncharacterized protein n=1 Tax=Pisolithus microcarpus 441 TaxID=765257 RepID=A0A0C9YCM0_9AGAM|nr:hypothetical protein PISMIDRAFT_687968 [Pisolithus microcarpus 441]
MISDSIHIRRLDRLEANEYAVRSGHTGSAAVKSARVRQRECSLCRPRYAHSASRRSSGNAGERFPAIRASGGPSNCH